MNNNVPLFDHVFTILHVLNLHEVSRGGLSSISLSSARNQNCDTNARTEVLKIPSLYRPNDNKIHQQTEEWKEKHLFSKTSVMMEFLAKQHPMQRRNKSPSSDILVL